MSKSVKLVVCALALALLAACGAGETPATSAPANGDTPAGSSDSAPATTSGGIPLFPGAKPLDDSSPMAMGVNMMKDTMKQQAGANGNITFDAYVLPSGTTFDKVKEFYNTELTKDGWQAGGASNPTAEAWIKSSGAESITVSSIPDPSQSVILIMQVKP